MKKLEEHLGHEFKNKDLLLQALTHKSYINESELSESQSYERLEFLGDAILELLISERLYHMSSELSEGEMTKLRSSIVCEPALVRIADQLEIGTYIRLSLGEDKTGGRHRASILADCVESIIAAIYLDGGMEEAGRFVSGHFEENIRLALQGELVLDYKSALQEWLLKKGKPAPIYELISSEGPDHNKTFFTEVLIENQPFGRAKGRSKRESEKEAAKIAYLKLIKKS